MQKQIDALSDNLEECKTEVGKEIQIMRAEFAEIKASIDELLQFIYALKGWMKVMNWIGLGASLLAKISAGTLVIYLGLKGFLKL